jgi:hypothetical protein
VFGWTVFRLNGVRPNGVSNKRRSVRKFQWNDFSVKWSRTDRHNSWKKVSVKLLFGGTTFWWINFFGQMPFWSNDLFGQSTFSYGRINLWQKTFGEFTLTVKYPCDQLTLSVFFCQMTFWVNIYSDKMNFWLKPFGEMTFRKINVFLLFLVKYHFYYKILVKCPFGLYGSLINLSFIHSCPFGWMSVFWWNENVLLARIFR